MVNVGVDGADEIIVNLSDRRELPEDEQCDEMIGEDHAEHGAGEQRHDAGQASDARRRIVASVRSEILHRVDEDQQADERHHQKHRGRQRIQRKAERLPRAPDRQPIPKHPERMFAHYRGLATADPLAESTDNLHKEKTA